MKQLILVFLLTMLACMVGINVHAHDINVRNADGVTIYYNWINNQTELEVGFRGYEKDIWVNEYSGDVAIPESVEYLGSTYPVTSIGEWAFSNCYYLTSITIPKSVKSIGDCIAVTCPSLTSIILEKGNNIYDSRENCNAIIKTSSNELISGCKNTVIPNSVTSIGCRAFYNHTGLSSILIPSSVLNIGDEAFNGCESLAYIKIPNSVTSIGGAAFGGTEWYYTQPYGILYLDDWLIGCKGDKPTGEITIKNGTKGLAECAFYYCNNLTSVTLPSSLTYIGDNTFEGCTGLTTVNIHNSVSTIGEYAFFLCSGLTSVNIPNTINIIREGTFFGCI